ncbi:MAG: DUF6291 domain-containing protein [Ruminococcus sp.]|nr:DUF6291 domain-containing protein [Ruminococcus sp.]MCM1479104.1 DUF6291 domain-containing protein [Muribaculaceae bacterium]
MNRNYHTDNKSFLVYKDWEEKVLKISDKDAGRLFKALFAFAKRDEKPQFDGALDMLFMFLSSAIEQDGKKWEQTCAARAEGGKAKAAKAAKAADTDKDKETEKDTDTDKDTVRPAQKRRGTRSAEGGGHSYDLDKLIEHALQTTPKLR